MQELKKLSDSELMERTSAAAAREKAATLLLLEHLLEVERRGLALKQGYGSVFEYVHKGLGYSEGAAGDRVAAMRLLKRVPEAKGMLATQKLTLTTAAKIQTFVRAIERTEGRKVEAAETMKLVAEVAGKSKREVERLFVQKAPVAAIPRERVREVACGLAELKLVVGEEFLALLNEAKILFGSSSQVEALQRALKVAVDQKKKTLEPKAPAIASATRPAESFETVGSTKASYSRYIPRDMCERCGIEQKRDVNIAGRMAGAIRNTNYSTTIYFRSRSVERLS